MQEKDGLTIMDRIKSRKKFFILLLLITIIVDIGFYSFFKNINNFDQETVSVSIKVFVSVIAILGLIFAHQASKIK